MPAIDATSLSVPILLVLGGMSSVVLATLWLTARLASIERSIMDLQLVVTKDFATNAAVEDLRRRLAAVEQQQGMFAEWRAGMERRVGAVEEERR